MRQVDGIDLKTVLPELLRSDRGALAICYALQPAMEQLTAVMSAIKLYTAIDTLTGLMLDELAWGLNIPWYNTADTDAAKREVIKGAIAIFRRRGTVSAIEDAVKANFGNAHVEEWFEYDVTKPGYFRIIVEDQTATTDKAVQFLTTVNETKNARSMLDKIILMTSSPGPFCWGCASQITKTVRSEQYG